MAKTPIATIKLAPGRVGFYDEYSRIHLTLSSPVATVYSGTNCAQLRKSVKAHVIDVISGSLGEDVPPFKIVKVNGKLKLASNTDAMHKPVIAPEDAVKAAEVEIPVEEVKTPVAETEEVTEAVPEKEEAPVKKSKAKEAKAEEVTEEVKDEEPAEEEKSKKKKTTRKKKAE